MCGNTHKTVRRVIERAECGTKRAERARPERNFDSVADLVDDRVKATSGRIWATRPLPAARVAGYEGSPRNRRQLVAGAKQEWRRGSPPQAPPAVWTPGEALAIDWGSTGPMRAFCAVLAWSRLRFVRFALN